jgi:hypothetical protein
MSGEVISMDEINGIRDRRLRALHGRGYRGTVLAKECAITLEEATERCDRLGLSLAKAAPVLRGSRPRRGS